MPTPAIQFQGGQGGSAVPAQGTPEYNALISAQNSGVSGDASFAPDTKQVSVMSTDGGWKTLNDAITAHKADMAALGTQTNNSTTSTPTDATSSAMKAVGGVTAEEAQASGINLSGYTYDPGSKYYLPTNGTQSQQTQFSSDKKSITDAFSQKISGMDDATSSLIQSLNGIYSDRIAMQQDVNRHELASFNTANIRSGTTRYAGGVADSILTADENAGLDRIKSIANEQANAIATANQNLADKKYQAFMDSRNAVDKLTTDYKTTLKDLQTKALDAASADKVAAQKIKDTISGLATDAAKNGADPSIVKTISDSKSITDALNAAGTSLQTGTGDVGDYLFYKNQAMTEGKKPMNFDSYLSFKAGLKSGVDNIPDPSTDTSGALGGDKQGGSILNQTKLSLPAFNYLTQGTTALTRMTAPERMKYMTEAQNYLNSKGIDVSTFQSQYKSYNDVLSSNISRFNKTKIMEDEVLGTADNLIKSASDTDMAKLKAFNLADLWAGKQVNDPTVQKYSFQLQSMRNDLAGYFAAARGATSPELQDMNDAQKVISDGINAGSTEGFKQAVQDNADKMKGVLERSVDSARKSVWDMFGVGDKYQPMNPASAALSVSKSDISSKIDTASTSGYTPDQIVGQLKLDPTYGSKVQDALNQGVSPQDIIAYLKSL